MGGAQAVSGWEGGSWEAPKKSSLGRPLKIIGRTWKNMFEGQVPAAVGMRGCHPEAQYRQIPKGRRQTPLSLSPGSGAHSLAGLQASGSAQLLGGLGNGRERPLHCPSAGPEHALPVMTSLFSGNWLEPVARVSDCGRSTH